MRQSLFLAFAVLSTGLYAQSVSINGLCGASNGGLICTGSSAGPCCSQYGWCGTTTGHCGVGCDPRYGQCTTSTDGSPQISMDGSCGGTNGQTCQGSTFGNCCSQYNYCGSTTAYCGTGCNPSFGSCNALQSSSKLSSSTFRSVFRSSSTSRSSTVQSSARSSSASTSSTVQSSVRSSSTSVAFPTPSAKVSINARCGNTQGATGGFTCIGSTFGSCCSQYGYCGRTAAYCGTGCQSGFGQCTVASSSERSSSSRSSSRSSSQALSSSSSIIPSSSQESSSSAVATSVSASQSSSSAQSVISSTSTQGDFASSSSASSSEIASSSSIASSSEIASSSLIASSSEIHSSSAQPSSTVSTLTSSSELSSVASSSSTQESSSSVVVSSTSTQVDVASSSSVSSSEIYSSTAQSSSSASALASSSESSSVVSSSSFSSTEAASSSVVVISSSVDPSSAVSSVPTSSSDISSTVAPSSSSAISSEVSSSQPAVTSSSAVDISSSSAGPLSSTATISATTMSDQISSTPAPTSSATLIASSSSVIVSSSVSSGCVPYQTNYLKNPGFETGVKGDWENGQMGVWSLSALNHWWVSTGGTASGTGTGVWPNIGRNSDGYAFRGTPTLWSSNPLTLSQKVFIPTGTKVTAGVWIKLLVPASSRHVFKLFLDNNQVGATFSPPLGQTWYKLTSTQEFTMLGTAAHTIRLELSTQDNMSNTNLFVIDDFELLEVPEPSDPLECGPPPPDPPPTCFTAPANYLGQNAGFETGSLSPWSEYLGSWTGNVLPESANTGNYRYYASQTTTPGTTLTLMMTNIFIPAGTNVRCNAYIRTLKSGYATYSMYIDGVPCLGYGVFGPMTTYANARAGTNPSPNANTISVSGSTHSFMIQIGSSDVAGPIFDLDDIAIIPSSGPNGDPICT